MGVVVVDVAAGVGAAVLADAPTLDIGAVSVRALVDNG